MADQKNNEDSCKDKPDVLKIQYNKLAEDWRYFNTLLWGIPSVAIAIMAGIIIAAYQKDVTGWARMASLGLGSFLLFALTIESIKKRQHMDVISHLIQDIQKKRGLNLSDHFIFPVGLSYDIEKYLSKLENKSKVPHDKIFDFFKVFYAREVLTFVAFVSAIVVAGLTDYEFVKVFHGQWPFFNDQWPPIAIGVILPLTVFGIVLYDQKGKKMKIMISSPATAYVFINCELGCESAVIDELRLLPQVMEAAEIYGSSYDVLAKVTADTESKLKEIIRNDIRRIGKVKATQTMMVVITI